MARQGFDCWRWLTEVLFSRDSSERLCAVAALLPALGVLLSPLSANAETLRDGGAPEREPAPARAEVLLRSSYAKVDVGLLAAGAEALLMPSPHYGAGVELEAFMVDNGADPQYSSPGTLDQGYYGLAFVEGDLLRGPITPFARLGFGLGSYQRFGEGESGLGVVARVSAGLALRVGPIVARASASPTLYGGTSALAYTAALGGRF